MTPCPIQRDPAAPIRTRQFIDQVHDILCSLIQRGELVMLAPGVWHIVQPTVTSPGYQCLFARWMGGNTGA